MCRAQQGKSGEQKKVLMEGDEVVDFLMGLHVLSQAISQTIPQKYYLINH